MPGLKKGCDNSVFLPGRPHAVAFVSHKDPEVNAGAWGGGNSRASISINKMGME